MKKVVGLIINSSNQLELEDLVQHRSIHTVPVGGKFRLIDFPLSNMVNMTPDLHVGVIGSYNYRSLVDHLKQGQDWNLSRKSNDLIILQGDRGAKLGRISRISIQDFIDNKGFFDKLSDNIEQIIISGANIVGNIDMGKVLDQHQEKEADITMLYKAGYEGEILNKEVRLKVEDNEVKGLVYGKDTGVDRDIFIDSLIINKALFMEMLNEGERRGMIDFTELIEQSLSHFKVNAYNVPGYVKIINSLQSYYECSMDLLKTDIHKELFKGEQKVYTKAKDNHPTVYGKDAKVKNAFVASGAVVNGSLESSIVFRNANIGKGAKIKNSIIMQGATVEEDAVVVNAILDKSAIVRSGEFITSSTKKPVIIKRRD